MTPAEHLAALEAKSPRVGGKTPATPTPTTPRTIPNERWQMSNVYMYRNPALNGEVMIEPAADKDTAYINTSRCGVSIPRSEAPAAALAILEAAGIGQGICELSNLADILYLLRRHIKTETEAKAKAEDEAKLDAEALQMLNALRTVGGDAPLESLRDHYHPARWREVALKARELHAPKATA